MENVDHDIANMMITLLAEIDEFLAKKDITKAHMKTHEGIVFLKKLIIGERE